MQLTQICRLCLEEKTNNETVLVEIFSACVNEPGKEKLNNKIFRTIGVKVSKLRRSKDHRNPINTSLTDSEKRWPAAKDMPQVRGVDRFILRL
jgi:hypothetical protein